MSTGPALDLFAPATRADPYAAYDELRVAAPVHRGQLGAVYLLSHRDVVAALRDPRLGSARPGGPPAEGSSAAYPIAVFSRTMLSADPPDHTRIRGLVSRAFTPTQTARLRTFASRFVDDALAPALDGEIVDIVDAVARPLPVAVVCEILGVAAEHRSRVAAWSADLGGLADVGLRREVIDAGNAATRAFIDFLREDHEAPADSVLHALAEHRADGALSDDELLGTVIHLLFAGHETTTSVIATGLLALLETGTQWRSAPAPSAVEELTRYVSPVQLVTRWAREPMRVGEVDIAEGDLVIPLLGAANRDPDVFTEPDRLDLHRTPNPHVTFGSGPHFCLGAPLARMEVEVFMERLAATGRTVALAGTPTWRPHLTLRGLESLPIQLAAVPTEQPHG